MSRKNGILLHPTSLPSKYGIGDLGEESYQFLDFLGESKVDYWQILPLTPPDDFHSPYQSLSAFAGNPLLISPTSLLEKGFLKEEDLEDVPSFPKNKVDFKKVIPYKGGLFKRAYHSFLKDLPMDYNNFFQQNIDWLPSYSLFMALRDYFNHYSWKDWPKEISLREEEALNKYKKKLQMQIGYHSFLQYEFHQQWQGIREYARKKKVEIIGDLPIFVAYESSDVWENPNLFTLNEEGGPHKVAGVPPDYFSKTGQRWGNPLYHWDVMKGDDYRWWRRRIAHLLSVVHIIRIDHFRGFEAYWEIDAKEKTAEKGRWVKGPGEGFFRTLEKHLGKIPVVAEDLGFITKEVIKLRKDLGYPGMKVLQFALEGGPTEVKKVLGEEDILLYTGTHDNNTMLGWYREAQKKDKNSLNLVKEELGITPAMTDEEICWAFMQQVMKSKASVRIFPLQDILALGEEGKMNTPGTLEGNWAFRYPKELLTQERKRTLKDLITTYT